MNYKLCYHIISVTYNNDTRVTRVGIVNESTGEVFYGEARRHPTDSLCMKRGTNLAALRAVRKAVLQDLSDDKTIIIEHGECCDFAC